MILLIFIIYCIVPGRTVEAYKHKDAHSDCRDTPGNIICTRRVPRRALAQPHYCQPPRHVLSLVIDAFVPCLTLLTYATRYNSRRGLSNNHRNLLTLSYIRSCSTTLHTPARSSSALRCTPINFISNVFRRLIRTKLLVSKPCASAVASVHIGKHADTPPRHPLPLCIAEPTARCATPSLGRPSPT